jgi:ElaB/YqjD/DUF883 family membrane-anchored ribosome-binding protein
MYQSIFNSNSESFKRTSIPQYVENTTYDDSYESYSEYDQTFDGGYESETYADSAEAWNPFRKKTLREKAVKVVKDKAGNVVKVVKTKGGKLIKIVKKNPWKTAGIGVAAAGIPLAGAYYYSNRPTVQSNFEEDGYEPYTANDMYEANNSFGYYEEAAADVRALKAEHKELVEAIFARFKQDVNALRAELTDVIKSTDNPAVVDRAKKAYIVKLEQLRTKANNEIVRTNVRYNGAYDTASVEAKVAKYVANADNIAYKVAGGLGIAAGVAGAAIGGRKLLANRAAKLAAAAKKQPGFVRRNAGKLALGGTALAGGGAVAADHFLNNAAGREYLIAAGKKGINLGKEYGTAALNKVKSLWTKADEIAEATGAK